VSKRSAKSRAVIALLALAIAPGALAQDLGPALDRSAARSPQIDPSAPPPDSVETPDELRSGLSPVTPAQGVANYGAPRPKTRLPKPYPPPRRRVGTPPRRLNPLPSLEPYKTSAVARRARREEQKPGEPPSEIPPTVAATPSIKAKPKPHPDPDPYAPIGIGVGSLRLDPFVETSSGYDDNPDRLPSVPYGTNNPVGSPFLRVDAGLRLKSDWERDDLFADLRLGYVDYFDYTQANRFDGAGTTSSRIDVTRDTSIDILGRYTLDSQRPGSPAISSGLPNVVVTNRPIVFSSGVSLGATQRLGRLEVSLRGSFDRTIYGDAYYSDGSSLILSGTDFNDYGITGRAAYEVSPSVKPFAEATYDSRVHDSYLDPYGYARDSDGYAAKGGLQVKITDLVHGEAAGGYAERAYKDPRLPELRGPTVDASLIYTPTPLTTVSLRATTTLNETTVENAAGTLSRTYSAQLSHDLLRNLSISAIGSYFTNNYEGASIFEHGYTAGVKLEYKLTRAITIHASVSHERLNSSLANSNYTDNVYMAGLRFQP